MPECTMDCKQFVVNEDTDNECLQFKDAIVDISWEIQGNCPHFEDRLKVAILEYIKKEGMVQISTIFRKFSKRAKSRLGELLLEGRIYYHTPYKIGYLGEGFTDERH